MIKRTSFFCVSFLLLAFVHGSSQTFYEKRIQAFKEKRLIVLYPLFEAKDSIFFKPIQKALDLNFRIALENFWDLNSGILYGTWDRHGDSKTWYLQTKRSYPDDIFLEFGFGFDGRGYWGLSSNSIPNLLKYIRPRPIGNDTTLLTIMEEIRLLRLSVKQQSYHAKDHSIKEVVIYQTPGDKREARFVKKVFSKYPNAHSGTLIDIANLLLQKKPGTAYVYRGRLLRVEDGAILRELHIQ